LKAVIMSGGKGTRLKPLTNHLPKPMVPVGQRRCIDYVLRSLTSAGIDEIIVTTGYLSDRVVRGIADGARHGVSVAYSFEDEPLGTAGGVKQVGPFLGKEAFIVASGDVLADVNIGRLVDKHAENKKRGAVATMALTRVKDPTQYGIVGLSKEGRIERFKEKPRPAQAFSDLVNAGLYVVEHEVLDEIPARQPYDFSKDLWPDLLERGVPLYGEEVEGFWMDVGRPEDLIEANLVMIEREAAHGRGPKAAVIMGRRVKVEAGAALEGPLLMGDHVHVGARAKVKASAVHATTSIGDDASITRSLILEDCEVGDGALIEGSVIGAGAAVGAGARLIGCVVGEGQRIDDGSVLEGARVPDN
jgi:NDP-sugar pyrophosphorylase family protein